MKKLTSLLVMICIILILAGEAKANSGPVSMLAKPAAEQYVVDKDSPISVIAEKLTFDCVSKTAKATYTMENPTDEHISARMAFPYIGNADYPENFYVTADKERVPFKLYFGLELYPDNKPADYLDESSMFDFDSIVSTITDDAYISKFFDRDTEFILYTFDVQILTSEKSFLGIDLQFDPSKTKIAEQGFNMRPSDDGIWLSSVIYGTSNGIHQLYVIGNDIDLNPKTYKDSNHEQEETSAIITVNKEYVSVYDYLMSGATIPGNSRENFYNIYAKSFALCIYYNDIFEKSNIHFEANKLRVNSLVYTVEFPPKSRKTVSVDFAANFAWTREKTKEPIYTLKYIFNPARYWSSFHNLSIEIIPPSDAHYIIDSSLPFQELKDGVYTAFFTDLPTEDLTVSFYYKQSVPKSGYTTPIIALVLVLIFLAIILRNRKRKRLANSMKIKTTEDT